MFGRTSRLAIALGISVLYLAAAGAAFAQKPGASPPPSLYKRVGGYDFIAAWVDDVIGRVVNDQQLSHFFAGHSADSSKRTRQLIVEKICEMAGGPCVYTGRDMKTSHSGLGITGADWDALVGHLTASLDKFKVRPKEKDELLSAVGSLKKDIVEKP